MTYVLRRNEPIAEEVPRVAREELESAMRHLRGFPEGTERGIHEARKHFKKLRALMRLVRKDLGDTFRPQIHRLRDVARELSAARDATVLRELMLALVEDLPGDVAAEVRTRIPEARTVHVETTALLARLEDARDAIGRWRVSAAALEPGWRRTYRRGHRALEQARAWPMDEHFHAWRKRVKDHWYHMRLLKEICPVADARRADLDQLAAMLGEANDFAVLEAWCGGELIRMWEQDEHGSPLNAFGQLIGALASRRYELWGRAFELGAWLYAEEPAIIVPAP